jgi:ABC-type dipeptide/oligopeptide/nickel transport system permease subunit
MVLATLEVGQVTLLEATLSFLGVGIPSPIQRGG